MIIDERLSVFIDALQWNLPGELAELEQQALEDQVPIIRLHRNLLESQIGQMQYILGKIGVEMGIGTANIITLLIPAFCKFLELRNDQIIASRPLPERTHTVIHFFSSINT